MLETVLHRWLRLPYTLHVRYIQRPRGAKQTLLFIHGIGTTGDHWREVLKRMPENVNIITIDLLGFGDSPTPKWAIYNSKTQARSVFATLLKLRITTPLTIVGHSLGALVAIELTKRYPLIVKRLILSSPPLYTNDAKRLLNGEMVLKRLYKAIEDHPEQFVHLSELGFKYKLLRGEQYLTSTNVDSYIATLQSAIVNQTSLADAHRLKTPTLIIRGTLDPLVISRNFTNLAKANPNVTIKTVLSGHDLKGRMVGAVVSAVKNALAS